MIWLFLLLAIVIFSAFIKSPTGRGWIGELRVKLFIGRTKVGKRYIINDLRIRTDDGKTSQIDHVVIQPNGLFVIETKNYSGRIYGNEKQMEWTQVLQYGNVKYKLYNPVRQNSTHVYRVRQIINNHSIPVISAIVFVQGNIQYIDAPNVYTLFGLRKLLSTASSCQISAQEMENLYNVLLREKGSANLSMREHISNIHETQKQIENGICPRCGGKLVERQHNGATFHGCSNYPRCRFTTK